MTKSHSNPPDVRIMCLKAIYTKDNPSVASQSFHYLDAQEASNKSLSICL